MRCVPALILLAGTGFLSAQTADDPEVSAARAEMAKVRALVEAGAAPRAQLAKAEESLADAADAALLRKTAYGPDLTVEQADGGVGRGPGGPPSSLCKGAVVGKTK